MPSNYPPGVAGGGGVVPFNAGIDDPSTILLAAGTGTAGSTTIANSGFYDNAITAYGNTEISAAESKWGGGSIVFDGNGDYLIVQNSSELKPRTGDFTYETWIYPVSYGTGGYSDYAGAIFDTRIPPAVPSANGMLLCFSTTGTMILNDGGEVFRSTSSLSLNAWHHVALVRASNVITLYFDGVVENSASLSTDMTSDYLTIAATSDGRSATAYLKFDGYMNDFRYSNVARYTSAFAPPAAAFPAGYDPALLPASPVAGQLALSTTAIYACTNATGPVWKRIALTSV